jgi:hypothetical protein
MSLPLLSYETIMLMKSFIFFEKYVDLKNTFKSVPPHFLDDWSSFWHQLVLDHLFQLG